MLLFSSVDEDACIAQLETLLPDLQARNLAHLEFDLHRAEGAVPPQVLTLVAEALFPRLLRWEPPVLLQCG